VKYEIEIYQTSLKKRPYSEWLNELSDLQARAKIRVRIDRVKLGNFGDCDPVGSGVSELRIHFGPGYRVYFGKIGDTCVLLLCGGTKRRQSADIEKAKEYFEDYKKRGESHAKK
jgi:putative addiction module killer protein